MNDLTFGRPFVLKRDRDISGVSGCGVVADGIVFPDGHAAIHWRGKWPLTTPHPDGLESILAIHDHGGQGDLHVIWPDVVTSLGEFGADLADIYELPAALLGSEAEQAHLHRLITRALLDAWEARGSAVAQPEQHCATFAHAVMPIVAQLQEQRDQAMRANGRAYGLARTWRNAHGASQFLVRAAGAELFDVLNDEAEPDHDWHQPTPLSGLVCRRCELAHKFWSGEACVAAESQEPMAAECSAEYHGHEEPRLCIRAAQHRGDHIDERNFHWSDTLAIYPVSTAVREHDPAERAGDALARADQAEELLRIANDTSNKSEAARQEWENTAHRHARRWRNAEAAITRVRDYAAHLERGTWNGSAIARRIREALDAPPAPEATEAPEEAGSDDPGTKTAEHQRDRCVTLLRVILSLDADRLPSHRVAQIRVALDQAKEV